MLRTVQCDIAAKASLLARAAVFLSKSMCPESSQGPDEGEMVMVRVQGASATSTAHFHGEVCGAESRNSNQIFEFLRLLLQLNFLHTFWRRRSCQQHTLHSWTLQSAPSSVLEDHKESLIEGPPNSVSESKSKHGRHFGRELSHRRQRCSISDRLGRRRRQHPR